MTQEKEIFEIIDKNEWLATPDQLKQYSGDNLIDAYLKGKKDGVDIERALIIAKVKANIKKSSSLTTATFKAMKDMGLNPASAYLRISDLDKYDILITIPENEFLDDSILDAYKLLSDLEGSYKDEFFSVTFSLSDISDSFSEKCVAVDGYRLKHA